ncbi:hypothetical protein NDA01_21530 [Trichocoleus desertorum AS-A10]|uniref:hypothetical protein n=1 Tax=Trichocoleus desertorum TaxID=1481672 RepID=UPI0032977CA0
MPKKIDWEPIKQHYLANDESLAAVALRFGVSKRAIEDKSAEGGWEALKTAGHVSDEVVEEEDSSSKIPHRRRSFDRKAKIDEVDEIDHAITQLSGWIGGGAEPKSLEGCASALAKLIELRRKLVPATAAELAEQVLALGISPTEFVTELKEKWQRRA